MLKRTQQKVSNSQDGMNDSQNANFIIAEAKKVLERSYIFTLAIAIKVTIASTLNVQISAS
jgi:hypothetical protein